MMFFPIHLTIKQVADLYDVLANQKQLPETLEDIKCQLLDIGYPIKTTKEKDNEKT